MTDTQKAQASIKPTAWATALTSSLNTHCAAAYQVTRAFMTTKTLVMTRMTMTPTFQVCLESHAVANCAATTYGSPKLAMARWTASRSLPGGPAAAASHK